MKNIANDRRIKVRRTDMIIEINKQQLPNPEGMTFISSFLGFDRRTTIF